MEEFNKKRGDRLLDVLTSSGQQGLFYSVFYNRRLSIFSCPRAQFVVQMLASKHDLYDHPLHPYTQSLLSAIPIPDVHRIPRKAR